MPGFLSPPFLPSAGDLAAALAHLQKLAPNRRGLLFAPLLAALGRGVCLFDGYPKG